MKICSYARDFIVSPDFDSVSENFMFDKTNKMITQVDFLNKEFDYE